MTLGRKAEERPSPRQLNPRRGGKVAPVGRNHAELLIPAFAEEPATLFGEFRAV
jgi:hypothetical protein